MDALEPNPGGLTYQQSMLAREQRFIERFKMHVAKTAQLQSQIKALDKIRAAEEKTGDQVRFSRHTFDQATKLR